MPSVQMMISAWWALEQIPRATARAGPRAVDPIVDSPFTCERKKKQKERETERERNKKRKRERERERERERDEVDEKRISVRRQRG